MTRKEIKNITGLRDYYKYLNTRFSLINLALIDVSDEEFNRMIKSRRMYILTFKFNPGFSRWLNDINTKRFKKYTAPQNQGFYKIGADLIKRILRSER